MGRRNSGGVINYLPAQKGRVSINLTQQRGGSLKFLLILYKFIQTDLLTRYVTELIWDSNELCATEMYKSPSRTNFIDY